MNGIALVTLELKRSTVAVGEGIRQTIGNQKPEYIRQFFTTVQLVLAGNDSEGLSYGVIDTPEKYWLRWRLITDMDPATRARVTAEAAVAEGRLDQGLAVLVARHRLLEMIHDFIVFDAGVKKTARPNQYFGVRAAQERMRRREGGIVWHTQGSGKSMEMELYANQVLTHPSLGNPTIVVLTDRTDLDDQLFGTFQASELLPEKPFQVGTREEPAGEPGARNLWISEQISRSVEPLSTASRSAPLDVR